MKNGFIYFTKTFPLTPLHGMAALKITQEETCLERADSIFEYTIFSDDITWVK